MKKQFTILSLLIQLLPLTAICQQQYPACFNNLVMNVAAMHKKNPCQGSDKLLRIDAFSYKDTLLYQLVFQRSNTCPDYINSAIFYDNNCQVRVEIRDGGLKYRHQVIPFYIDTKQLVFIKSIEWQQNSNVQAFSKNEALHPVTDYGKLLQQLYLGLNVENGWLAGSHINWETGVADRPEATSGNHTHCSAFVAAACKRMNIYILRPPEHKQELLANAQYEWMTTKAASDAGWRKITGDKIYEAAQVLANEGKVVVATCKNEDESKPGHIALVLPAAISKERVAESGPEVIMAGTHNHNSISLKTGFKSHLTQWPEQVISFYYNEKSLSQAGH